MFHHTTRKYRNVLMTYMFTDFYISVLFDKNLHEGMHSSKFLRLYWEWSFLSSIDLYDLNFRDISWTFHVYPCICITGLFKINMRSTYQNVGFKYVLIMLFKKILHKNLVQINKMFSITHVIVISEKLKKNIIHVMSTGN